MTVREELERVLDPEHAQAVIEHRKAKKCPLREHAAMLLARQFERWHDPNEAADEMILRGWQGFKAEWMRDVKPPQTQAGFTNAHYERRASPRPDPEFNPRIADEFKALAAKVGRQKSFIDPQEQRRAAEQKAKFERFRAELRHHGAERQRQQGAGG